MLCRQGPSERYAPLGLSFPPLSRRAPAIHEATGGYAAPKAPAGQSCSDDVFPVNTDDWGFPLTTDDCDIRRRILQRRGARHDHIRKKASEMNQKPLQWR